jgi:hypothetical protein
MKTTLILALLATSLFAQSPAAKPDGNPKVPPTVTAPATVSGTPTPAKPEAKPEEHSLSSQAASELSQIEQAESQFQMSVQQMVANYQNVVNSQKQQIFAKACAEAGWPLPKQGESGGCQGDLGRRLVVNVKPEAKGKQ